jgi:CheY-like chemotaxis protein
VQLDSTVTKGITSSWRKAPALILADVTMPAMEGFELLRRLHAEPRTRKIPVLLLSARG